MSERKDSRLVAREELSSLLSPRRDWLPSTTCAGIIEDRHRSISGAASELCKRGARGSDEEPGCPDSVTESDALGRVTFIHSSFGVINIIAVTSKKSKRLRARPLCMRWGRLVSTRKRGSRIFTCGGARCIPGSKMAIGPLTVSVVHWKERNNMRTGWDGYIFVVEGRTA